LKLVHY